MAKKQYDFRPDKPYSGLLSKLHLTQGQRLNLLKWVLYSLCLVMLSVVQDVFFSRGVLFGATTDLIPCAILLICVLQGSESSLVFGLVASTLYLFSGTAPGAHTIVLLTFLGFFANILRQSFLRKGFSAAMLCTGVSLLIYEIAVFLVGLVMGQTYLARCYVFLLAAVVSFAVAPVLYPLFLAIGKIGGESWKE